jgi:hypothetical protein
MPTLKALDRVASLLRLQVWYSGNTGYPVYLLFCVPVYRCIVYTVYLFTRVPVTRCGGCPVYSVFLFHRYPVYLYNWLSEVT